ncbi:MAG: MATE family efflux transporter [Fusobacterium sp.]|uniref:MATE family efflux transporter n=1 Tax=Fusobacterium sp. TaxID=68766 RepID=UPI0026DB75CD|nr:MATE family efflux transporter [Fusobacterium sp.]MDO4690404.1 MATE family efflux transporter [Fusobacterium sp.]
MLKNSISKTIFRYSFPNVLSMWVFTLYSMVDGIFVSRYIGKLGFAGVNLTFPLINLIFAISIMLGVGSSTLISIKFGEKRIEEANKLLTLASLVNFFLGLFITFIILINLENVINILGVNRNQEVYIYLKDYLSTIILFSFFYTLGYAFEIYIKIDGSPSYPLICVLIGGVFNIFLDYLLMAVFSYGIKGAAIATGISQMISCSMLFFYIQFKAKFIKFSKIGKENFKKVFLFFKFGFSEFITEISTGLLILIYNWVILTKTSINTIPIFGVISYITSIIVMTMIGFSQGIQPIISYNLGKKNYSILKSILKISLLFLTLLGFLFFISVNYFSVEIASLFFKDISLIEKLTKTLRIYSFYYLILGINIFISSYLSAIKKIFYSALITFPRGILFNSIFLMFLPDKFGENGIWFSAFFSEFLTLFISFYLLFKIKNTDNI